MNRMPQISLQRFLGSMYLVVVALPGVTRADITSNLQVRYWFDKATGTSAADSSGNHRTATLANGAIITDAGRFGGGVHFDGTNDLIDCPPITATDGASQLTISFWLNTDSRADYEVICAKYDQAASKQFAIQLGGASDAGNDDLIVYIWNSTQGHVYTTGNVLSNGTWIHVAVVYDGSQSTNTTKCKIYINGQLASLSHGGTVPTTLFTNANDHWYIGWRDDSPAGYALDGKIDEFHLYTRALSASDVTELYQQSPPIAFVNPGILALTQHIIPRDADGATHPAGKLQGQGPMSVIQGILYGPVDGTNPHEIVVTEDYGAANMSQWTKGIGGYAAAVLQPVVRDLSIFGKVDAAGYEDSDGMGIDLVHSDNMWQYNRLLPLSKGMDFNASTSKFENTGADVLAGQKTVTVCCWIDPDTKGESDVGFVFVLDEQELPGTASFVIRHDASDDKLAIVKNPGADGTTNGVWTIPITDGAWNAVCVRLDFSGDYAPTARVNLKKVPPTQVTAPVGISNDPATGYCVGNRTVGDRTWDGRIAQVQVFNRILSDGEADSAIIAPGSVTSGLQLHLPMDGANDIGDDSVNMFHGSGAGLTSGANFENLETGLAIRASGPLVSDVGFSTSRAPPASSAAIRMRSRVPFNHLTESLQRCAT